MVAGILQILRKGCDTKKFENPWVNGCIANLSDVLTLGPILAGHLECRQDALLDVERRRRFERTAANVDNSSIDK
jgi:hypothetical protein